MNEKIRELSETCYTTKYNPFGADEEIFNTEKFAELIVKECCDIIQGYESPHHYVDGMIYDIKNQFGIE